MTRRCATSRACSCDRACGTQWRLRAALDPGGAALIVIRLNPLFMREVQRTLAEQEMVVLCGDKL